MLQQGHDRLLSFQQLRAFTNEERPVVDDGHADLSEQQRARALQFVQSGAALPGYEVDEKFFKLLRGCADSVFGSGALLHVLGVSGQSAAALPRL